MCESERVCESESCRVFRGEYRLSETESWRNTKNISCQDLPATICEQQKMLKVKSRQRDCVVFFFLLLFLLFLLFIFVENAHLPARVPLRLAGTVRNVTAAGRKPTSFLPWGPICRNQSRTKKRNVAKARICMQPQHRCRVTVWTKKTRI